MAGKKKGGFYAVRIGRKPGVYTTWPEAEAQVSGMAGCVHKKFPTLSEAQAFVEGGRSAARKSTGAGAKTASTSTSNGSNKRARVEDAPPRPSTSSSKDVEVKRLRSATSSRARQHVTVRKVFCDGSSRGNGKKGAVAGIGVYWNDDPNPRNLSERLPGSPQTNNRAEMFAVARILETDPNPELPLTICSDSQYTISVFSQWITTWRKRNWKTSEGKPVLNQDLIEYVVSLISLRMPANASASDKADQPLANVSFQKVKAHVGIMGNECADHLANEGALKPEVPDRDFVAETRKNNAKLKLRGLDKVNVQYEVHVDDLPTKEEMDKWEETQVFD